MAQFPLSTLRGYLKNLSDWVKGDAAPAPVQLTGSYVGYSSDVKPAGKEGDSFVELDTKKIFLHDGTNWGEF